MAVRRVRVEGGASSDREDLEAWHTNEHRIHDLLRPYDELDEVEREKDRAAIREIPLALAAAGFAVQRSG